MYKIERYYPLTKRWDYYDVVRGDTLEAAKSEAAELNASFPNFRYTVVAVCPICDGTHPAGCCSQDGHD